MELQNEKWEMRNVLFRFKTDGDNNTYFFYIDY